VLISAQSQDGAVRVMAKDGSFRAIAVSAPDSVQAAMKAQGVTQDSEAALLGELMLGASMIRETMAPGQRLQMVVSSHGSVAADTHPEGMVRAILRRPPGSHVQLRGKGHLQVMRAMFDGQLHQGTLEVQEEGGMSAALQDYLLRSEQVESVLQVCCVVEGGQVKVAHGYLVQRLPEAQDQQFVDMQAREAGLPSLREAVEDKDLDPAGMVARLMGEIPYVTLETPKVFFGCNCSYRRVLGALVTLGKEELQQMVDAKESVKTDCDYCGEHFEVGVESLRGVLASQ
jgi:molecular chaperone Hsp33